MRLLAIGELDTRSPKAARNAACSEVSLSGDDKVVFLGDYVDKGPDVSEDAIDLLIGLGHSH